MKDVLTMWYPNALPHAWEQFFNLPGSPSMTAPTHLRHMWQRWRHVWRQMTSSTWRRPPPLWNVTSWLFDASCMCLLWCHRWLFVASPSKRHRSTCDVTIMNDVECLRCIVVLGLEASANMAERRQHQKFPPPLPHRKKRCSLSLCYEKENKT